MKKIVIIGASELQNPLILKAKSLGFETHVFAWKCGDIGESTADFFYPISILEKENILVECLKIKPDAVVSIASDVATITVNYLCAELKLPCNSMHCTEISTNKFKMRTAFKNANIKTPQFFEVDENFVPDHNFLINFPAIVKPTDRSGSRGITKITEISQLLPAIKASTENSFEKKAIVEEYIEGDEFSCECITHNGVHKFLAFTKKFTTGAPNFIEIAHFERWEFDEKLHNEIIHTIFSALDALEITNSASHSEFKVTPNGDVMLIEIGARMGGDCIGSHLVELSTGVDFVKMVIDVACGNAPIFPEIFRNTYAGIRYIFGQSDFDILENIKSNNPKIIHYISPISTIGSHKIVDSSTRYGFYILCCENRDEVLKNINPN